MKNRATVGSRANPRTRWPAGYCKKEEKGAHRSVYRYLHRRRTKGGMGEAMTKNIFATLGLLGLFLAIGLGLVAAFGGFADKALIAYAGNTPTSYQPSGKATKEDISQLKQSATDVGKTVKAGDLTWAITRAHAADDLSKAGPPYDQHTYAPSSASAITDAGESDRRVIPRTLTVASNPRTASAPQYQVSAS